MNEYVGYYLKALKNYAVFDGRARRTEFWSFALINFGASILLDYIFGFLSTVYSLAVFIPSIAVAIRRMHDVGKSGWFCLIPIYNLILALTPGEPNDNKFGEDPKSSINEAIDF